MPTPATYAITIGAPGSGYHNKERGFYLFDSMTESHGRPDYTWGTWGTDASEVRPELAGLSSLIWLEDIHALICRPYPRWEDDIPLSEWVPFGDGVATWEERADGLTGGTEYAQYDCALTGESGMVMAYDAPPNPAFGIVVRRYPLKAATNVALSEGYTRIVWGGGRFELIIPYSSAAALYDNDNGACTELPINGHSLAGGGGAEHMQEFVIWIAHLGGKVLFSWDGRKSWWVYGRGEQDENAISIAAAAIQVSNVGAASSAWMFRLVALDYPSAGTFISKDFNRGYTPSNSLQGGGSAGSYADWKTNTADGYTPPSVDITPTEAGALVSYEAILTPTSYPAGSTWFGHTPELAAVRLQNKPVCETVSSVISPYFAASELLGMEIEDACDLDASRAKLTLNNIDGLYEGFPAYSPFEISLAGEGGALTLVFCGYSYSPSARESHNQASLIDLEIRSAALPFCEVGCTEAEPVFAGKTIGEAIEWAALRCGVVFDPNDWDCDTVLPSGIPGSRTFQPGAGRFWSEFLREVCSIEQGYLRFAGWELGYYRPATGTPVATWFFADRTDLLGSAPGCMPMLDALESNASPENQRNDVVIIGQDLDGRIVSARQRDATNRAATGWDRTVIISDPAYDTQACINQVCRLVARKVFPGPQREVSFQIEGNPAIFPRAYCQLFGGVSDYHEAIFEIKRVVSRWTKATGRTFRQDITATWVSG